MAEPNDERKGSALDDLLDCVRECYGYGSEETYFSDDEVAAARVELAALRERVEDYRLVVEAIRSKRIYLAVNVDAWTLLAGQQACGRIVDGLPALTPEARAALRGLK